MVLYTALFVEAIKTLASDVSTLSYENVTLTGDVSTLTDENIGLISDVSILLYAVSDLTTRVEALEASIG